MTNVLPLQNWLKVIREEYLQGFIKDGGGSIKFAVPMEPNLEMKVKLELRRMATELDYIVVDVNAGETKVHMPQEILFKVAGQIDWRLLTRRAIHRLAQEYGYKVDGIEPDSVASIFRAIGQANAVEDQFILQELRPRIQDEVFRNRKLAKDFRVAMTQLCRSEIASSEEGYGGAALIDWLTGANRRVASVRHFSISNSISRTNARYYFESLLHWVRYVGFAGLVMLIDTSRVTLLRNPLDGLNYYSRPAVIDHYELLREFIDGADRLEGCLMVVVTNTAFLDDNPLGRGFGAYQALMGRIIDEVRDRSLVNPMSSLIRLAQDSPVE